MKGVRYLARLLASRDESSTPWNSLARAGDPGDMTHGMELGLRFRDVGDAGELLDAHAKEAYRRRLIEIEDDLEQARALRDASRMAQATAERDFLARELSRAVGLGGRDRRVGSAAERARASVTRAVRHAMRRIRAHHPPLGRTSSEPSAPVRTAPIFLTLASRSRGSCNDLAGSVYPCPWTSAQPLAVADEPSVSVVHVERFVLVVM